MKLKFSFLLSLCLFFQAGAQDLPIKNNSAGTAYDSVRNGLRNLLTGGLQIGDKVPDLTLKNINGLRSNGRPVTQIRLSELQGKIVIIDFWATWCGPCRTLMYHLDSLQKQFADQVIILPVTYETKAVAEPVLDAMNKARPFELPYVNSDVELQKLFPHRTLPHEVWLDKTGIVRAITEGDQLTPVNIRRLLNGQPVTAALKQDIRIAYDKSRPLLIDGNGGAGSGLFFHSVLSKYIPGISGGLEITAFDPVKGQRFSIRNAPLQLIYAFSFGERGRVFPRSRVRIQTQDPGKIITSLRGQAYRDWLQAGNGWCYELVLPPHLADSGFRIMQQELRRLFPMYRASVERETINSLVLVRTSPEDKLRSTSDQRSVDIGPFYAHIRKGYLIDLMMRLEHQYLQGSALPIADGTGYTEQIDLDLEAPLSDLAALNNALAAYGLAFVEKPYPADLLVIRDHIPLKP